MGASSELKAGRASDPPAAHLVPKKAGQRPVLLVATAMVVVILLYFFPLFHVIPLNGPVAATAGVTAPAVFDAAATAAKIWQSDLPAAARRALELETLIGPLRENAETSKAKFGKSSGLGAAYYFVRGNGRVVGRERNALRIAVGDGDANVVTLRIGPVFGNTVRDGCGFLDVNAFPGLQEFNALSAELNALVEKNILPGLREKAVVGATVQFAGCAEAPESPAEPGEPLLILVPVQAEVSG